MIFNHISPYCTASHIIELNWSRIKKILSGIWRNSMNVNMRNSKIDNKTFLQLQLNWSVRNSSKNKTKHYSYKPNRCDRNSSATWMGWGLGLKWCKQQVPWIEVLRPPNQSFILRWVVIRHKIFGRARYNCTFDNLKSSNNLFYCAGSETNITKKS